MGFASSLCVFTGPLLAKRGWRDLQIGRIFQDALGEITGLMRMTNGVFLTAGGLVSIATVIFFITAVQMTTSVAQIFSFMSGGLFGAAGLISVFLGIADLYLCLQCRKIITNGGDNPEKILQTIMIACKNPLQKNLFQRVLGSELLLQVLDENRIISNEEIVAKIREEIQENSTQAVISTILSIVTIVLGIFAFVFTGVVAQYAFIASTLLMGILWIVMDIQQVFSCYASSTTDNWEKLYLVISALFSLAILAASIALCTHPVILSLLVVVSLILIVMYLGSIYKTCFTQ